MIGRTVIPPQIRHRRHVQFVGDGEDGVGGNGDHFGQGAESSSAGGAEGRVGVDAISYADAVVGDVGSFVDDEADDVHAGGVGEGRFDLVEALGLEEVGVLDSGVVGRDEDVVSVVGGIDCGGGDVVDAEDVADGGWGGEGLSVFA